jgi:hypothetical protein
MAWTALQHVLFWIRPQARHRARAFPGGLKIESGTAPLPPRAAICRKRRAQLGGSPQAAGTMADQAIQTRRFVAAQQHLRAAGLSPWDGSWEISC